MAGPGGAAMETLNAAGEAVIENEWIFPFDRLLLTGKTMATSCFLRSEPTPIAAKKTASLRIIQQIVSQFGLNVSTEQQF